MPWHIIGTGDFNRDGWTDLGVASTTTGRVVFLRGSSAGFRPYFGVPPQSSPRGIDVADINQDGWVDIAIANRASSTVTLFLARTDGSGLFDDVAVGADNGSRDVVTGDFDWNGQIDIATANEFGSSVTVLMNRTPR